MTNLLERFWWLLEARLFPARIAEREREYIELSHSVEEVLKDGVELTPED